MNNQSQINQKAHQFIDCCYEIEKKNPAQLNNNETIQFIADFPIKNSTDLSFRLSATRALLENQPVSPIRDLCLTLCKDMEKELLGNGFIEQDIEDEDPVSEALRTLPRTIQEPTIDNADMTPITDEEFEDITFNEYAFEIAENPHRYINNQEAIETIANHEDLDDLQLNQRMFAALRLMQIQPKTPLNQLCLKALEDYRKKLGIGPVKIHLISDKGKKFVCEY